MRSDGKRVIRFIASPEEDALITTLRRQAGYSTDANLMRDALWSLAEESGLEIPEGCFGFKKSGNPRPWQAWAGSRAKKLAKPTVQLVPAVRHTRKPAKAHPWRNTVFGSRA